METLHWRALKENFEILFKMFRGAVAAVANCLVVQMAGNFQN